VNIMETTSVYWHFPMLIITVSMVYAATRFENWNEIFREALVWGLRMTLFLVGIGVGVHVLAAMESRSMWIAAGCVAAGLLFLSLLRGRQTSRD